MLVQVLFRIAIIVCFDRTDTIGLDIQMNTIHRLRRIITSVRQYYSLHPNYSKDTYGTVENYLRRHVSEPDWVLLTQCHLVEPAQTRIHNSVSAIA